MKNYAIIDKLTKKVVTNIVWDGESPIEDGLSNNYDFVDWDETTKGYPVGIDFVYDFEFSGFIPLKPENSPSFIFDKENWIWTFPIPYPNDGNTYIWNEEMQNWELCVVDSTEN